MIIKKVLSSVISISIIATSLALLGAATAPYIDPETSTLPAFLGLMYPFLLLLHMLLFVAIFLVKRNMKALLFLLPALCTIHLFLNSFGVSFFGSGKKTQGNVIKVMTYNVHSFTPVSDSTFNVHIPMMQLVKNEQPDILCTQDFRSEKDFNTIDTIKTILKSSYFYNGPGNSKLFPTRAIATFSKCPIVNSGFIVFPGSRGGNQAIFTDIIKNGKIIRIYNVHFKSLGFRANQYEEWKNGKILGKLKFLFKVKDKFAGAFADRSRQVKLVRKHTETCPYPFIIAGDFNDTPSSFAVNSAMTGMKNAFREKGRGYTVTFNGGLPDFQIDYVLVKPFFKVLDYKVIREKLSDHYPVVVKLSCE